MLKKLWYKFQLWRSPSLRAIKAGEQFAQELIRGIEDGKKYSAPSLYSVKVLTYEELQKYELSGAIMGVFYGDTLLCYYRVGEYEETLQHLEKLLQYITHLNLKNLAKS